MSFFQSLYTNNLRTFAGSLGNVMGIELWRHENKLRNKNDIDENVLILKMIEVDLNDYFKQRNKI